MKKLLTHGAIAGAMAFAALTSQAADTLKGDPAAGEAQAAICSACHGTDGNSMAPTFPKLAGLGEKYLLQQLQHIQSGLRPVPTMAGQLDNKSDQDLADLAAYFSSFPRGVEKADPSLVELGEQVYRAGIADRNVAACIACHGPRGAGNAPAGFPAIGGQHAGYVSDQLKAYRLGYESPEGRVTDGDIMIMRSNAFGLSDLEIEALSSYISGLN